MQPDGAMTTVMKRSGSLMSRPLRVVLLGATGVAGAVGSGLVAV